MHYWNKTLQKATKTKLQGKTKDTFHTLGSDSVPCTTETAALKVKLHAHKTQRTLVEILDQYTGVRLISVQPHTVTTSQANSKGGNFHWEAGDTVHRGIHIYHQHQGQADLVKWPLTACVLYIIHVTQKYYLSILVPFPIPTIHNYLSLSESPLRLDQSKFSDKVHGHIHIHTFFLFLFSTLWVEKSTILQSQDKTICTSLVTLTKVTKPTPCTCTKLLKPSQSKISTTIKTDNLYVSRLSTYAFPPSYFVSSLLPHPIPPIPLLSVKAHIRDTCVYHKVGKDYIHGEQCQLSVILLENVGLKHSHQSSECPIPTVSFL